MLAYTSTLETQGTFLTIWDEHCLIGTPGAAVVAEIIDAINIWCDSLGATVDFIAKGTNILTEHVGAFEAKLADPDDPSTYLNMPLIKTLECADFLSGRRLRRHTAHRAACARRLRTSPQPA
jgi:nicotinamidase/pyrazinamidase